MTKPIKNRILSGVQPTGNLHLGNYLGAIKQWVALQDDYDCLFMLADLHAITVPQDPAALKKNTRETAAAYIACGVNPDKAVIYPQSAVPQHAELAWILGCHTPLGWLNRMTQFKEKTQSAKDDLRETILKLKNTLKEIDDVNYNAVKEGIISTRRLSFEIEKLEKVTEDLGKADNAPLGLYAYPVLMAADILLYKATHVPVGEDQKQHLELARDIAGAFNRAYPVTPAKAGVQPQPPVDSGLRRNDGEKPGFFPLPEPVIMGAATRVMSLQDGMAKMSKSDPSEKSRITLTDDADTISRKIMKSKADMDYTGIFYDKEKRPEISNLMTIYAALADISLEQVGQQFANSGNGDFKKALAELAVTKLSPITARMRELSADTVYLDKLLASGAEKARAIAETHLKEVKQLVGFLEA